MMLPLPTRAVFAGLSFTLLLAACGDKAADDRKAAAPTAKPALTVTTTTPEQAMLPVTLTANGNLAAFWI